MKKHYRISKKIYDHNRSYPEKKDGISHHVSFFIHNNTDIVVLTLFCGVKEVSVYSVYNSVVVAISNLMGAVASGIAATVGNIIALDEKENLKKTFEIYSTVNAAISTFFCVCFALLLLPFVTVYTRGIADINYIRPIFAYLLIATQWIYFLRIPYTTAITSAGHYKQTKWSAVIEAAVNVGISLVFVNFYGITGVIAGTFFAMLYRTAYTVWYLSKNIMHRRIMRFVIDLTVNMGVGFGIIVFFNYFMPVDTTSLWSIFVDALRIAVVALPVISVVNVLINKDVRLLVMKKGIYSSEETT